MVYIDTKRIERVLKNDVSVYKEIKDDKDATMQALIVIWISMIIGGIWSILTSLGLALIGILIFAPISWLIGTGILHIIAKLFGGKGSYQGYLRALGYTEAPMALGVIPVLGSLVGGIWSLILTIYATKEVHELSMGKAVLVVLIPVIIVVLLIVILGALFFTAFQSFSPN